MLIVALGFTLVVGSTLTGLNERDLGMNDSANAHYDGIISRNIANSGANIAVSRLYRDFYWRDGLDSTDFNYGDFSVDVEDINFDTALTVSRVRVTSISNFAGRNDTVTVVVARPPFSYFAQFSDQWPTNHYFITGDTLYGPVHTNQRFGMSGYPVFFSKVSSVAPDYATSGTTNPQFLGGTEFGAAPITLPLSVQALEDSANSGGDVYNYNVWLRFNADGSYDYGNSSGYSGGTKYLSNYNGVIMSTADIDIHVKGTIHGQLTIYSGRRIYIEDNIFYSQDPRVNPNAQDVLGLVSKKDVVVVNNTANQSNCEIHAAIMALDDEFRVQDYNSGSPRGTLTVLGSIVQRVKGPIGTFTTSGGVPVLQTGYFKKWLYDSRFLHVGPPVFPLVPKSIIYSWAE
jgi:hypothetical protein